LRCPLPGFPLFHRSLFRTLALLADPLLLVVPLTDLELDGFLELLSFLVPFVELATIAL